MAQIDTLTNVGAVVSTDLALILRGGANVLGTFGSLVGQNATAVTITGGTVNGTVIGGVTSAAGSFTTGQFGTSLNVDGTVTADGLTVDGGRGYIFSGDGYALGLAQTAGQAAYGYIGTETNGDVKISDTSANKIATFHQNQNVSFYEDTGTTAKLFWDASAESLGIGTSSPVEKLYVNSTSGDARIGLNAPTGSDTEIKFSNNGVVEFSIGHDDGTDNFVIGGANVDGPYVSVTKASNLLVGKTASDLGVTAGIELNGQYDVGYFTRSGDKPLVVNRLSSDGSITDFRKDGTTVGSIGVELDRLFIGSDDSMIFFDAGSTKAIWPWTSTATSSGDADDTIDIGDSANRFKDLYLSGGVYLGGTGAANKLDDYEEGTWTPTIVGSTSGSITGFTVSEATYTKIGDTVRLSCYLTSINMPTSTVVGSYRISGLPFSGDPFSDVINVSYCNMFSFDATTTSVSGYCGGSVLNLLKGSSLTAVTDADEGTNTAAAIMLSIVYKV